VSCGKPVWLLASAILGHFHSRQRLQLRQSAY
jgi:hypothetical protein